jgi:uncharacterized membrane protein YqhA
MGAGGVHHLLRPAKPEADCRADPETWMSVTSALLRIRSVFLVVSVFSFISCLFFIALGIAETVRAFSLALSFLTGGEAVHPGIALFEALDRFLIAVLFYIFGIGMIKLFVPELFDRADLPDWLDVKDIRELKVLLWETVLVTLMVLSVSALVSRKEPLSWDALILPAFIAILSVSLFFMRSTAGTGGDRH